MIDKLKYIIFGISIIIAFLWGKSCVKQQNCPTKETIIHKIDTIKPDTIHHYIPKPYFIHDTTYVLLNYKSNDDSLKYNQVFQHRFYKRVYRDSLTEFTVQDTILGYLIGRTVDYRLFVPLKIIDTTIIEKVSVIAPKWVLKGGLDMTRTNAYLGLDLSYKKDELGFAYDPFNKVGLFRYRRTLFSK